MKFLVVDDSATMRRIITTSLERIGYTDFVEASNGFEALAKFGESIQFVMSGIELIRKLRARPDGKTVPVLMVTTNNTKEDVVVAAQAGANGFLVKPISLQGLKEKIEAILNPREPC